VAAIDAEVTELKTKYELDGQKSRDELVAQLVGYERERFLEQTHLDQVIPMEHLEFTDPGRFDEIVQHIDGHKYYVNQSLPEEISFSDAALSWYYNVFQPIIQQIVAEGIMSRFPGRTKADLYLWIVKHWDELKRQYGEKISLRDATRDYSDRQGTSLWKQFAAWFKQR
jgi:hypothetical protein